MIDLQVNNDETSLPLSLPKSPSPTKELPRESTGAVAISRPNPSTTHRCCFRHNPTVMAMLSGNTMRNCEQVEKLYAECQRTGATDRLCQVAEMYHKLCLKGINLDNINFEGHMCDPVEDCEIQKWMIDSASVELSECTHVMVSIACFLRWIWIPTMLRTYLWPIWRLW